MEPPTEGHPMPLGATWCKPVLRLEPMWHRDPGRRAGRQVIFHVSPRPGQAPTSSQALCNYLLLHFQPKPHLSLTPCPSRKGGESPLICHLLSPGSALISHSHRNLSQKHKNKNQNPSATAKGQTSAQIKSNLLCRLCISTVSL